MGTTADKLNKILQTKQEIKQAIIDKGVEVSAIDTFASYSEKIRSIQSGTDEWFVVLSNNGKRGEYLFYKCYADELNLSNFDVSNMTNMEYMFAQNVFLTSINMSNWDTSNVTNMTYMFYFCTHLVSIDVSMINVSNVITMLSIFGGCTMLASLDCSNWDVSKCTGNTSLNMFGASSALAPTALVDFKAPKNIGAPMNLAYCTALSHDSLMSVINNLITVTTTKTLTLGATNLAKLTDEEKAIATNKGWTLA